MPETQIEPLTPELIKNGQARLRRLMPAAVENLPLVRAIGPNPDVVAAIGPYVKRTNLDGIIVRRTEDGNGGIFIQMRLKKGPKGSPVSYGVPEVRTYTTEEEIEAACTVVISMALLIEELMTVDQRMANPRFRH